MHAIYEICISILIIAYLIFRRLNEAKSYKITESLKVIYSSAKKCTLKCTP